MKRLIYCTLLVLIFTSCLSTPSNNTDPSDNEIQTGDLLFISLPSDYNLEDTTYLPISQQKNYIHIAILERDGDSLFVIDATLKYGVHRHPLQTEFDLFTLRDGTLPHMEVMRLNDNSLASRYVENAKRYVGAPYDVEFRTDNDAYYCSELVSLAYSTDSTTLFPTTQLHFTIDDGTLPVYWTQLCKIIGRDIPKGEGIMPSDIIKSDLLKPVECNIQDIQ